MISPFSIIERRDGVVAVRLARGSSYYSFLRTHGYFNPRTHMGCDKALSVNGARYLFAIFNRLKIELIKFL
jgi:hypothetical protein